MSQDDWNRLEGPGGETISLDVSPTSISFAVADSGGYDCCMMDLKAFLMFIKEHYPDEFRSVIESVK